MHNGPRQIGRRSFVVHLHPARIARATLDPRTTFGLGIASLTLFAVLAGSGLLLALHYTPSDTRAYDDMRDLIAIVPFGEVLRSLHRVATQAMLVVVVLHMLRVVLTLAYQKRRLNWLIGLALLLTTLGFAFTGYLLPWDQRAYWACTVGADMLGLVPLIGDGLRQAFLGGGQIGSHSLLRFYVLHVAILPSLSAFLVVYHLWRIRKDGGLAHNTRENT